MPAVSRDQQIAAAIALHHPEKLKARNRSMLKMSRADLHDFASKRKTGRERLKKVLGGQ